jgi:hypothetical protein
MKKLLLVTGAAFFAVAGHAQFNQSYLGTGFSKGEKSPDASQAQQQPQAFTQLMNDTLHYFFNKHYYMNDTVGSANLSFYTYSHPNYYLGDTLSHSGSIFMNTGTVTIKGLEGLVSRDNSSLSQNVPVKLYLHYLNNVTMLPIMPAIDSVSAIVGNSTQGNWYGGNFTSPRTVTNNFAVTFRCASTNAGDTLRLFMNNANTTTSTATGARKYSDKWGVVRYGGTWYTTTDLFGAGTGYEFIVAPRVSLNYQSNIAVVTPTICNNSVGTFSNNSTPMFHLEHRQWNFNQFAAYWTQSGKPTIYEFLPPTDSTWNWTFTGAAPPATNVKNPSILFNNAGTQTASLAISYWLSCNTGWWMQAVKDGASATIFVDASSSPTIALSPNSNTNICQGQTTTLSVSGNPTFTWTTQPPSNQSSISVSPGTTTQYTVLANNGGCTAVKIITVQVSPAPNVSIAGPSQACVGQQFSLTASGAPNYQWSNTSQATVITVVATTSGSVQYTVIGSAGSCPNDTAVKSIVVNPNPVVSLTAPSMTACSKATGGKPMTLTGSPANGLYSGTGVAGGVFTPNNVGNVAISYVYTDANTGCSGNAAITVTVVACAVGIDEQQMSKVSVFPNPALDGVVYIQNISNVSRLSVVNILGQQIRTESVSGEQHRLDLSSLPAGQYFIMLSNPQGVVETVKIVNQH